MSSEGVSSESSSDTGPFEYTHEYSRDYGKTWHKVPPGKDLIGKGGANKIRAVKPLNWIGDYDEREDYVIKDVVPQVSLYDGEMIEPDYLTLNSDGTIEKVSGAEDYKVFSCGFGASGYSPGGVSWIPADAQQERKAKWRKRFHMKGRKNV